LERKGILRTEAGRGRGRANRYGFPGLEKGARVAAFSEENRKWSDGKPAILAQKTGNFGAENRQQPLPPNKRTREQGRAARPASAAARPEPGEQNSPDARSLEGARAGSNEKCAMCSGVGAVYRDAERPELGMVRCPICQPKAEAVPRKIESPAPPLPEGVPAKPGTAMAEILDAIPSADERRAAEWRAFVAAREARRRKLKAEAGQIPNLAAGAGQKIEAR
jgi:hypothetical protein